MTTAPGVTPRPRFNGSTSPTFRRAAVAILESRLLEPRRFIQVVAGPRQVGKSTAVQQALGGIGLPVRHASADEPTLRGPEWIAQQWEAARLERGAGPAVLVLEGEVLSYTEMLGQLQDAGNVTTLVHYLELLGGAGLVVGVPKFAGAVVRQRSSRPKLQELNTALMTAPSGLSPEQARSDRAFWRRLIESAVGSHLANDAITAGLECSIGAFAIGRSTS